VHSPVVLLLIAAGTVGVVHAALPDHWAPIAVVARAQGWSLARTGRISLLAAGGHVVASLVLGGVIAVIGLQFLHQFENQQARIVGAVLVATGAGFLAWGLTGRGRAHDHRWHEPEEHGHHEHDERESKAEPHEHQYAPTMVAEVKGSHVHEHIHDGRRHSHRHNHESFIHARADLIAKRSVEQSLVGRLTAIIVPFGVAASPDLTFLPVAAAASAYGQSVVAGVLGVFAVFTVVAFVGLAVGATAAGYHMRGEWLENNANTITSLLLIAVGVFVFVGL
jgi:nickel/cobalt transporter (NicO) family protein